MNWQDFVIGLCQLGFVFAMIPTIVDKSSKPPLKTSIPYATLLTIIAITMLTLELWFASLTAFLGAICWMIIAFQKTKK